MPIETRLRLYSAVDLLLPKGTSKEKARLWLKLQETFTKKEEEIEDVFTSDKPQVRLHDFSTDNTCVSCEG